MAQTNLEPNRLGRIAKEKELLSAQYNRLSKRRGPKRAIMAVGHSQLCVIYEMLKHSTRFADLGGDYFETRNEDQIKAKMIARLENMGYKVTLENKAA